jgi:hypothetical protein
MHRADPYSLKNAMGYSALQALGYEIAITAYPARFADLPLMALK